MSPTSSLPESSIDSSLLTRISFSLAYAEIFLVIAKLITTYDMELHKTGHEDVEIHHGRLTGFPQRGKGKIRVKVTRRHAT